MYRLVSHIEENGSASTLARRADHKECAGRADFSTLCQKIKEGHSRSLHSLCNAAAKPAKSIALRDVSLGIGLTFFQRCAKVCSDYATPSCRRFAKSGNRRRDPRSPASGRPARTHTCLSTQSVARSLLRDVGMRRRPWTAVRSGAIDSHCASRPPSLWRPRSHALPAPRAVNAVGGSMV